MQEAGGTDCKSAPAVVLGCKSLSAAPSPPEADTAEQGRQAAAPVVCEMLHFDSAQCDIPGLFNVTFQGCSM